MDTPVKDLEISATHAIFVSDIHFGVHVNSEEWQENIKNYFYNFFIPKIKEIKSSLKDGENLVCLNLGDTYNDRKAIDINVYNLCIDVFEDIAKEIPVYIINGNHDLAKKTNEGNTSLRSLEYIPNITVITEPTFIKVNAGEKKSSIIAIPYLGNSELENNYLINYSGKAKYALMHTELSKMKMDNGMLITGGANPEVFKGLIFAGHIHRRQESKKAIYVGSPYHLNKGDIGNKNGIYVLNFLTNKYTFTENIYSPIYHSITIEDYSKLNEDDRLKFLNNNYNFVLIPEDDLANWKKKYDIYDLGAGSTAKFVKPLIVKHKQTIIAEEENDYKEKTIEELLYESIDQLDIDDDTKKRLDKLSDVYLKDAENKLMND
jgi:DNA repair exonuclease SbcCD nuclease subunit